jgi:dolichyl-phosphate beta-glucosyltransferase
MQNNCIVIPCYNEAQRLNSDLIGKYLNLQKEVVLVFVNDGSTDDTVDLLNDFKERNPDRIFTVDLKTNSGKAQAILNGILFALNEIKPKYIGYLDADLSTPFSEMDKMFILLNENEKLQAVFGSRVKRMGSKINRSFIRHYMGRVFATVVSIMLDLPVYDSQCGAKVMTAEKAEALFRENFVTSWLFDVELLYRYKLFYGEEQSLREVYEYPLLEWNEYKGSKIRLKHILAMPVDLMKIYLHYRVGYI